MPRTSRDHRVWEQLRDFVRTQPKAFSRDPTIGGHVTGSAFVLSPDCAHVLLTHHAKLNIWVQLGGHCDGIEDARFVAQKEAYEESGLPRIDLLDTTVFDIDIHEIPARKSDPTHLHYDVRFLMQAISEQFTVTDESHALAWVPLAQLENITTEPSMLRMRDTARDWLQNTP